MNVGSGAGHGRWRSEQMSQLLERLLPCFLQILAMLLLVGGFYLPLLLFLGGQDPLQPGVSVLRLDYLLEFLADPWNLRVLGFSLEQAFWSAILSILLGFPGAWLAILFLRHKSSKPSFLVVSALTSVTNIVVVGSLLYLLMPSSTSS